MPLRNEMAVTIRNLISHACIALSLLSAGSVSAEPQPPEPPGISPADQRPELPSFEEPEPTPKFQLPPVAPAPPGEVAGALRIFVRKFELVGNTVFSNGELSQVTAPYEGREITSDELENLRIDLTRYYVDRGYINSGAVIPDQTVQDGIVRIQIVEGVLSEINVSGNRRLRTRYVEDRIEIGDVPLNINQLQEKLQLLQQNRRIEQVDAALKPGAVPGQAELDAEVVEARPYEIWLIGDNRRPPSVGAEEARVSLSHYNLTGFGDTLTFDYSLTEGLNDVYVRYSWPVTARDTTLDVGFQRTDADVVESPFDDLDIQNDTKTYTVGVSHPLYRTTKASFNVGLDFDRRRSKSKLLGERFSFSPGAENGLTKLSVARFSQEWLGRSFTTALAARSVFSVGLDLDATANGADQDAEFFYWLGQFQWAQRLPWAGIESVVRTDVQLTNDSLPPIEQFAIGGMDTVRGYRVNQFVRDNAFVASLEFRVPVYRDPAGRFGLHLAPFADYGRSSNKGRPTPGQEAISSVGLGLRATITDRVQGWVYWGYSLDDVDNPEDDDLQDNGILFQVSARVL
jgi:hemolysin activation/secretion protein